MPRHCLSCLFGRGREGGSTGWTGNARGTGANGNGLALGEEMFLDGGPPQTVPTSMTVWADCSITGVTNGELNWPEFAWVAKFGVDVLIVGIVNDGVVPISP